MKIIRKINMGNEIVYILEPQNYFVKSGGPCVITFQGAERWADDFQNVKKWGRFSDNIAFIYSDGRVFDRYTTPVNGIKVKYV
jgi:hypothetical protein